ncbi:hypothetical protein FD30_GL000957 [Levilactobacillus namurensis DSM 19117]|uniref:Uncharacterized protein n=1 Tax=Levilactobacillus namurensis DSM 19117 TaxID=1423773 RepID=A0A0R1JNX3_9LACO|nr:ATP-dependent DNA helicase RecQ [Levilactobacillus namurensis]KRK73005.1 hypothetical protein FD30_GL000957 [Levilactobacillus namurensis DSM 19117]MCW3778293.1 ATP-dependent DNA helicase RecQ [Levilactobacillus namurensis]MDT7019261.1 ATP-dependent DNA helicase RecQ [Levilactobacillus namurensis]WNN66137.1 ATP-dependent DNA helicase RecQ [Levilactobacillus namurensis]GEO73751.1 hypothetical protein LNA02_04490 [Levilactobacillus namurensis]
MDLVAYLKDEIEFLTDQMKQAEADHNSSMRFLCDSRIEEAKHILKQIDAGKITKLKP